MLRVNPNDIACCIIALKALSRGEKNPFAPKRRKTNERRKVRKVKVC